MLSVCYVAVRTIAIEPRVLSHHIVDFLGSRRMETAPMCIEVFFTSNPSSTLVYTAPGVCQAVTHPTPYSVCCECRECLINQYQHKFSAANGIVSSQRMLGHFLSYSLHTRCSAVSVFSPTCLSCLSKQSTQH